MCWRELVALCHQIHDHTAVVHIEPRFSQGSYLEAADKQGVLWPGRLWKGRQAGASAVRGMLCGDGGDEVPVPLSPGQTQPAVPSPDCRWVRCIASCGGLVSL